jgi:hypothetical protein
MLLLTLALLVSVSASARAFDPEETFTRGEKVLSVEGSLAYFGPRLPPGTIQAWSLGARFSLLPFGVVHFERLHNIPDGALELGVEPSSNGSVAIRISVDWGSRFDTISPTCATGRWCRG